MRIIAGRFKNVDITTPKDGRTTRPTTDRAKEAIFSRLEAWGALEGARVLDLFAGTGALGFEALSRGARSLVAVEANGQVASCITATIRRLQGSPTWKEAGLTARVVRSKAEKFVSGERPGEMDGQPFDLVFMDPPYAVSSQDCHRTLSDLALGGFLSDGAQIVLERSIRTEEVKPPQGWEVIQEKKYGETLVSYLALA
ncbi:MAG: 16S rRNA (guanine(966)-N(2))-methyltransferase RsmD [Parascardovia denticolens]|mgnify:CR=1 FL=1|uniref:16S rRNA (guanine(966)-N(2))-methyltransferase RsmD n=1 Tax=Parascardovia denticolens TaxID=78258 RepID=UPI00248F2B46|nr:16S rRNA (guanine(966)-N(2))-methyltransferase RsmD [Parascardovia denticolens]